MQRSYFKVLEKIEREQYESCDINNLTEHVQDRKERIETYRNKLGKGNIVDAFVVDKNHPGGNEIHILKDNRVIEIFNQNTKRFITVLYARPSQIKRYYDDFGKAPEHLFDKFDYELNLNKI